jgi:hypothetical protein
MICNGAPPPGITQWVEAWKTIYTWNLAMTYAGFVMMNLPTEILRPFNEYSDR